MELDQNIQYLKGVGPKKAQQLQRLGIQVIYDLLTYYPRAYEDQSALKPIAELVPGERETVCGILMNVNEKRSARGLSILTALLSDGTGYLQVTWFNQKFLKPKLKPGCRIFVSGKAEYAYGGHGQFAMSQLSSFEILPEEEEAEEHCGILPVYPSTEKLNQKFFRKLMQGLFSSGIDIPEVLPSSLRGRYQLLERAQILQRYRSLMRAKKLA